MPQSSYEISAKLLEETAKTLEIAPGLAVATALNGVIIRAGYKREDAWGLYGVAAMALIHFGAWLGRRVREWELETSREDRLLGLRLAAAWCRQNAKTIELEASIGDEPRRIEGDVVMLLTTIKVQCYNCGTKVEFARRRWAKAGETARFPCPKCECVNRLDYKPSA